MYVRLCEARPWHKTNVHNYIFFIKFKNIKYLSLYETNFAKRNY